MRPTRHLPLALAAVLAAGCTSDAPDPTSDTPVEVAPDDEAADPDDEEPDDEAAEPDDEDAGDAEVDADDPTDEGADNGTDLADEPGPEAEAEAGSAPPDVPDLHPRIDDLDEIVVTITTSDDDVRVDAKLASDAADRQRGLMEVTDLPGGVGMLFLFEEERRGGFWMKDTLVPLDIAYSSEDGEILEILTMEPCESDPCPTYDPEVAYLTALEVPAGWFDEVGVTTGDELTWSDPVPAPDAQG